MAGSGEWMEESVTPVGEKGGQRADGGKGRESGWREGWVAADRWMEGRAPDGGKGVGWVSGWLEGRASQSHQVGHAFYLTLPPHHSQYYSKK